MSNEQVDTQGQTTYNKDDKHPHRRKVQRAKQKAIQFEIIDGEHRWKAAKKVGWKRLRAFVIPLEEDGAKAFNMRKNRERGHLDAEKMGKILFDEYQKEGGTQNGVGKKFGMSRSLVEDYLMIYENRDKIRQKLNIDAMASLPFRKSRDVLRELKHPQQERHQTTVRC